MNPNVDIKWARYIKQRVYTSEARQNFRSNIEKSNILDLLGHYPYQDPNTNHSILHDKRMKLKKLPIRFKKFDKHKHRGNTWITKGMIKSIKYKGQLYRALKGTAQSDLSYTVREHNLSAYNKILKKSIREGKIQDNNAEFEKSKHDIKKTWKTIADIVQIFNIKPNGIKCILDNGRPVKDQLEIANKFDDFFINIGPSLTKNMLTTRIHNYGKYLTGYILSSFQFDLVDDDTIANKANLRDLIAVTGLVISNWI